MVLLHSMQRSQGDEAVTIILVVGGLATLLLVINAAFSFGMQGGTWRSWFRLQVAAFSFVVTTIVAGWFR